MVHAVITGNKWNTHNPILHFQIRSKPLEENYLSNNNCYNSIRSLTVRPVQHYSSNCKENPIRTSIVVILLLGLGISIVCNLFVLSYAQKEQQINLTGFFVDPEDRWKSLMPSALDELRTRHPNLNIQINYTVFPYNDARTQMLKSMANGTPIDLISLDQIWLGEFANNSYILDITNRTNSWGGLSDWYQANLDGNMYNGKVYGIWAWTDIRSIWYWKDLLNQTGVDPKSLKTWDGYIQSAKKLRSTLEQQKISGIELVGGPGSQNEWYPFLWMLGGDILEYKPGHPTKGVVLVSSLQ